MGTRSQPNTLERCARAPVQQSPTTAIKRKIASHPIAAYLMILYPLALLFNLPTLLGKEGLGVISADVPFFVGIRPSTILGSKGR